VLFHHLSEDEAGAAQEETVGPPPQEPAKRDTRTHLDKMRAPWWENVMHTTLDKEIGPYHIPSEDFQEALDDIIRRHEVIILRYTSD
jgi:hypothetical protein